MTATITIPSDLTPEEVKLFKPLLKAVPPDGTIVEVGTGAGGTACMFRESTPTARIITIDPYLAGDTQSLLSQIGVRAIKATSEQAAREFKGQVDLLFLDGGHDFKSLVTDIQSWQPKMASDGIVVFDDYERPTSGGMANLAVKIALDVAIDSIIEPVDRWHKMLVARFLNPIDDCYLGVCQRYYERLSFEDGSERAECEKLESCLNTHFWSIVNVAGNQKLFRRCIETYYMLQLTRRERLEGESDLDWLNHQIAFRQVELNLLRQAIEAYNE